MNAEEAVTKPKAEFSKWVKNANDEELNKVFDVCSLSSHAHQWEVAKLEISTRRHAVISRPHWSVAPAFWVAVLGLIFAAIAAFPVIQSFFQQSSPGNASQPAQPQQSR